MASPLYFVERTGRIHGQRAVWFDELDRDTNCAGAIRCLLRHDADVIRVLEVIEPCEEYPRGQCLDVTDDMRAEALAGFIPEPVDRADRLAWQDDHRIAARKMERV